MESNEGTVGEEQKINEAINTKNKVVNLEKKEITSHGAMYLTQKLRNNERKFSVININENQILDQGTKHITDYLNEIENLTEIALGANQITDEGLTCIAESLKNNKKLAYLNLNGNNITDIGVGNLAEVLKNNKTLTDLNLMGNKIQDHGAKSLVDALESNKSLTKLNLDVNNISEIYKKEINNKIRKNRQPQRNKKQHQPQKDLEPIEVENVNQIKTLSSLKVDYKEINFDKNPQNNKNIILGGDKHDYIYLATFKDQTKVAVKKLAKVKEDITTIKEELEVLLNIHHPNVSTLNAYAEDEDFLYLITDLFKLGDLYSLLQKNDSLLTPEKRLEILHQLADALEHLHGLKTPVFHKDIKALNVLVSENISKVSLSNFGSCQQIITSYSKKKQTELHSLRWMAPELFHSQDYLPSYDVYSFGILMWEVLSGKIPYQGIKTNDAVLKFIASGGRPNLQDVPDSYSSDVKDLIEKCWQKEFQERPSMKEVCEFLKTKVKE